MSEQPSPGGDAAGGVLLGLWDRALPQVYGYLLSRCGGHVPVAEDLTAETFLAAADAAGRPDPPQVSIPWLIGVARHKLIDHWRQQAREERSLRLVGGEGGDGPDDPWDVRLDALLARAVLERLGPHHRAALTLRYLDDLPVRDVAAYLERTVAATEVLLVRARAAFRRAYEGRPDDHGRADEGGHGG